MKILILYGFPLWGNGSGTFVRNTTQELVRLGHKVGIVAPEERRFLEDKINQYKVNAPQIPVFIGHPELPGAKRYSELSRSEISAIYKAYLDTVLEAVSNFEPDIIHVHHLSIMSWIARYVGALYGIKYVITVHGTGLSVIVRHRHYFPLCEDAVRQAKALTTVSGDTRSRILKVFGKGYAKNVRIIPGGVDMSLFPAERQIASEWEEQHGIAGKKIVFFSGRLTSEKGAKYLVGAAKYIKGEIFVAGDGPERQHLVEFIAKKRLSNVHLLGYLNTEELYNFYYRADVLVSPSVVDEALGLSILEAMAAGTPVIATRKGGIPLLVKHGHNGLFVKSRNSKDIANACNRILEDDETRKRMGENARKSVSERFTWKRTSSALDRLFLRIARNGKNGKK